MQKLKSSVLTTSSCPKFSLKPEVNQNIALHASPLTRNSCLLICSVPVHSPFCCFLLLVCFQKSFSGIKCIVSSMCPQHMIAAQLIFTSCWCIFPCLDPTEYTHRIKPHTILVTLIAQIYLGHRICLTKTLFYHNMIQKTAEFCVFNYVEVLKLCKISSICSQHEQWFFFTLNKRGLQGRPRDCILHVDQRLLKLTHPLMEELATPIFFAVHPAGVPVGTNPGHGRSCSSLVCWQG